MPSVDPGIWEYYLFNASCVVCAVFQNPNTHTIFFFNMVVVVSSDDQEVSSIFGF